MENPTTSSPGLAFLLATIANYGAENYLDYWLKLKANGLVVVNDWETAYYTNFSASSGKGPQPMVVSYGTSPAAEVVYASTPIDTSPTASLTGDGMCFRQVEFIGILKGTKKQSPGRKIHRFYVEHTSTGRYSTANVCFSCKFKSCSSGCICKKYPDTGETCNTWE